jgi:ADP-heptose:LPS heptosyltransferase
VTSDGGEVLAHIGAGIGNVVLATPLLVALHELRFTVDVWLSGAFVGNDSGPSHIAAAVGTPTVMIFGPTSEQVLGSLPLNVRIVRSGLRASHAGSTNVSTLVTAGSIAWLKSRSMMLFVRWSS